MSTPLRRWRCSRCGSGCKAPSAPRKNDVRRYCLPCSEETGKLVERVLSPSGRDAARRQRQRIARANQRVRKTADALEKFAGKADDVALQYTRIG